MNFQLKYVLCDKLNVNLNATTTKKRFCVKCPNIIRKKTYLTREALISFKLGLFQETQRYVKLDTNRILQPCFRYVFFTGCLFSIIWRPIRTL